MIILIRLFVLIIMYEIIYLFFKVDHVFIQPSFFLYKILALSMVISIPFFWLNKESELNILREMKEEVVVSSHYVGPIIRTTTFTIFVYISVLLNFFVLNVNDIYKMDTSNFYVKCRDRNYMVVNLNDADKTCEVYSVYEGVLGDYFIKNDNKIDIKQK